MQSRLLYAMMQVFYLTVLVGKCIDYRKQVEYFQVACGITVPLVLIYLKHILKLEKKVYPSTHWAKQLFLRSIAFSLLTFEDQLLRESPQVALCTFQNIILGLFVMKYCISAGKYCSEQSYHLRIIITVEVTILVNVNQFLHRERTLQGNIMMIGLSLVLMVLIIYHNTNFQRKQHIWSPSKSFQKVRVGRKPSPDLAEQPQEGVESILSYNNESHRAHQNFQQMLEEQRNFFKVLFDQLPYGMLILSESNQIQNHNIFVTELMQCSNEDEAFHKILNLKNCSYLLKEQELFNELFKALNSKLTQVRINDTGQFVSQMQSFHFDMETYQSKQQTVQTEFENIKHLSKALFSRNKSTSITAKDLPNKFQFACEAKMICCNDEVMDESDALHSQQLFEVILRPYLYEDQLFVLFLVRDVTLFNQVSVLQKVNENKSLMLAQVAHEFRNPLNVIICFAANLIDQLGPTNPITSEYLQPIEQSANQLLGLVNDLLDLAQLRAGKFKLTNERFDLQDLLINVMKLMTLQSKIKNLYLQLVVDPANIKTQMVSDPKRIQQIIMNLISNSIKFTNQGGVTLELKRGPDNNAVITLRDTGAGIEKQDQDKLFKAFGKLSGTSQLNRSGVGLGLMISNILAQKLSADNTGLQVYSDGPGQGSAFTFTIQDHSDKEPDYQDSVAEMQPPVLRLQSSFRVTNQNGKNVYKFGIRDESNSNFSNWNLASQNDPQSLMGSPANRLDQPLYQPFHPCKCIELLVVDDERFNLMALSNVLERYRIKMETASSGKDCLKMIARYSTDPACEYSCKHYRVILLDIEMPEMDGYQTSECIRDLEKKMKITPAYIIAYTGYSGDDLRRRTSKAGMNDIISKPVRPKDFLMKINQLAGKSDE